MNQCSGCGASFETYRSLLNHQRDFHGSVKPLASMENGANERQIRNDERKDCARLVEELGEQYLSRILVEPQNQDLARIIFRDILRTLREGTY